MTRDSFSFGSSPNPDAQLAYLLQHSPPGDPRVLDVLLERSAADLYRLVRAVSALGRASGEEPDEQADLQLTGQVLLHAVRHLDQFWGQASVPIWLYGLALDKIYGRRGRQRLRAAFRKAPPTDPPARKDKTGDPALLAALHDLPAAPRLAALLRYSHNLSLEAIALLLQVEPEQVHAQLVYARQSLFAAASLEAPPDCQGWTYDDSQPRARLQQRLDGLLQADPYTDNALSAHLNECPGCRQAGRTWQEFEKQFSSRLHSRWTAPAAAQRQLLAERTRQQLQAPPAKRLQLPWRQVSLAALLVVAVAAVALVFNEIRIEQPGPTAPENLEVLSTAQALSARSGPRLEPTPLPTPLEPPPPERSRPERLATFAGPNRVWSSQPALSASGRYLAFASLASYWVPGDVNAVVDVFLYDLQTDSVQRISQAPDGAGGQQASFNPSVSYDGQVVAYYSSAANLLPEGSGPPSCADLPGSPGFPYNCGDILLYDTATAETIRVTTPADPQQPLAGEHQAPELSATGRYVAFFSTAQDFAGLPPDAPSACLAAAEDAVSQCADLYIFDRNLRSMERIPIGRPFGPAGFRENHPPSITGGGNLIVLTLLPGDAVAPNLNRAQAVLYDRQTGEFSPLDQQPGSPTPDGDSFNPVIADLGGSVAFISTASNLVPGDDNGVSDVFLRNLSSGIIRRVSVNSNGEGGDGPSGVFLADNDEVREKLAISADGRFVAFVSAAGNMAPELSQENLCWTWEYGTLCAALYLHDSITAQTTLVAAPENQFIFHQPSLSGDGLRLVYGDDRFGCRGAYPFQVCADLWVYDLITGERRQLSPTFAERQEALQQAAAALEDARQEAPQPDQPDDLPALRAEDLLELPEAHRRRLGTLDLSPDGRLLATGSDDESVILWDAGSLQEIDRMQSHRTRVTAVRFSPDGDWLASGSADGTVHIWRTDEFARQTPLRAFSTLRSRRIGGIEALDFSPDERWLAIGTRFGLWIWEREGRTFTLREDLSRADLNVRALDFSPRYSQLTGTLLAAGLADGTTALYTLPSGNLLGRLGGQDEPVLAVAFDPQGELLAAGGQSNVVDVWQVNLPRRQPLANYQFRIEHRDWITDLAFSPSSQTLISTSYDDTLRYTSVATGELQMVAQNGEWRDFLSVRPSPDGLRLYAGRSSGSLMVFSVPQTGEPLYFQQINVTDLGSPPPDGLPDTLLLEDYPPFVHPENPVLQRTFSYNLDELAGRSLLAPTALPDGLQFIGAHLPPDAPDQALFYYLLTEERTLRGAVLLRQGPAGAQDFFAPAIPTSALVQPLEIDFDPDPGAGESSRVYAELVRGGWYPDEQGFAHWDPQQPVQRLHWVAPSPAGEPHAFSLEFFDFPGYQASLLRTQDLLDMASSVQPVDPLLVQTPVEVPYLLPGEQSCEQLAAALDVPVEDLLRLNRLGGIDLPGAGCENLSAGQPLLINLPPEPYLTQDLDCDGSLERLQLLPAPEGGLLGFTLQARDPAGFYADFAQVRVQDNLSQVMQPPVLHRRPYGCEWFVQVQVSSPAGEKPLLRLLRWHDRQLQTVLSLPGELTGLSQEGTRLLADTRTLVQDPAGDCALQTARHSWDGGSFVERESARQDLEACPPPGAPYLPQAAALGLPAESLAPDMHLLSVADLDCDQTSEYLLGVPAADGQPGQLSRLLLAQPRSGGLLLPVYELTSEQLNAAAFSQPTVFKGGPESYRAGQQLQSCWFAFAVEVWEADQAQAPGRVAVLGWDGGQLYSQAAIPGRLQNLHWLAPQAGQPPAILTHQYLQPPGGQCRPVDVSYGWDGGSFIVQAPPDQDLQPCQPVEQSEASAPEAGQRYFPPTSEQR